MNVSHEIENLSVPLGDSPIFVCIERCVLAGCSERMAAKGSQQETTKCFHFQGMSSTLTHVIMLGMRVEPSELNI